MLPAVLKNFNLFVDGVSYAGSADEVTLPKLTRKMEEFRAGGMNAPISTDMGQEKLELEYTLGGLVLNTFKQYANVKHDGVLVRFAGAYQSDDTGNVMAVEVVARGRHAEIDMGNAKAGDKAQTKIKMNLSYYKLTVNNAVLVEIDPVNFVEIINGRDLLLAQRIALGLA